MSKDRQSPENSLERQLNEVIASYLLAIERGESPERERILADHPELSSQLRDFFDCSDQLASAFSDHDQTQDIEPVAHSNEALPPTYSANPDSGPEPKHQPSERIGHYRLLQLLGEGGMGSVWMAEQTAHVRRRVAIKLIKPGTDSKRIAARFEAERQAIALMDHPNIAKIYDAGVTADGRPYFVMELVVGLSITDYCDSRKLSVAERLKLFSEVCRAVQHAHQKGIIHRDLKPSNILVTQLDGKPTTKIIDFGLAKALQDRSPLTDKTLFTEYGQIVGTLTYMSPEQAELNALDIDTRADVYALGVLLYELLTGSTPLTREETNNAAVLRILQLIREKEPPRPSVRLSSTGEKAKLICTQRGDSLPHLSRQLEGELDWIVMKALEKDRIRRYDGAGLLADDVDRFLADEPISARPPSHIYRLKKLVRKHRLASGLSGALLAVILTSVVATSWLAFKSIASASLAVTARSEAEAAAKTALEKAAAEAAAKKLAIDSEKKAAKALNRTKYFLGLSRMKEERFVEAERLFWDIPEEERKIEWKLAMNELEGSDLTLTGHTSGVTDLAIHPNGGQVATSSCDRTIRIWDTDNGRCLKIITGNPSTPLSLEFVNSGRELLAGYYDGEILLIDCATGEHKHRFQEGGPPVAFIAVSPDQETFVTGQDKTISVWDLAEKKLDRTLPPLSHWISCAGFSPDGTILVTGSGEVFIDDRVGITTVWNTKDWTIRDTWTTHDSTVTSVTFSPDGNRFATSSAYGKVQIRNLETSAIEAEHHIGGWLTRATYGPDGLNLLVTSNSHANLWDSKAFFEVPPQLMGHRGRITATGFLKEGRQVITASDDGEVKVWDIANGDRIVPLRYHVEEIGAVTFSADGKLFATGDWDGEIAIWETNPLGLLTDFKASKDEIYSLAFDSDCKSILVGDSAGQLMKWTLEDPKPVWARTVSSSPIQFIDFDNQTRRLATDHSDGVAILSADSGETLQVLQSESRTPFYPCGFSDDGNYWTGQENPGPVVTWDLRTGAFTSTNSEEVPMLGIAHSFDKSIVLTAGDANYLSVYDTRLREVLCRIHDFQLGYTKFWLSRDGSRLLMNHTTDVLTLFDTETGEELKIFNLPTFTSIEDFAISPQEDLIILKGEGGQLAALPLFQPERTLLDPSLPKNMMTHQFDQSSKRLLVELTNDSIAISKVRLFDLQSRRLVDINMPPPKKAERSKLSMDGKLLAVTSIERDENFEAKELEVCVWDVSNLENPQVIQRISMKAIDVAISRCCRYVAFEKEDHSVTCRELSGDRVLEIPSAASGRILAFAPTSPTLAISSFDQTHVSIVDFESKNWDVTTIEINDQPPLSGLRFDWTGRKVIADSFQRLEPRDERSSGSYRNFVSIWDVNTRKRLYLSEETQLRASPATKRNDYSPINGLLGESLHQGRFLTNYDLGLVFAGALIGGSENSVVLSESNGRVLFWDQASGIVESSNTAWKFDPSRTSPDGRWHFWKGRLTDLNYGQSREIALFRQFKSQPSIYWHVSQLRRAISQANGQAVRFHLSRLPHILSF